MYRVYHFIRYFPTYIKFMYTNHRFKKHGYRRFKYSLYLTVRDKNGNVIDIKKKAKNIIIKEISQEFAFYRLRDEHHSIFELCDHLTYKEII